MSQKMNLSEWLINNQLSDLQQISNMMTLHGLLNLSEEDARSICSVVGLESEQIDRLINALNKEKEKEKEIENETPGYGEWNHLNENENENEYDYKNDDDDIKDDGNYPVWPLIIPNNCTYNSETGKMIVDNNRKRDKLQIYKPALDFIRNISCRVATISIVGRARTGKSLIAGELYAPNRIPCPFDLGHKMDACTYGVWVSAKTIKHPYNDDTVILIFDVEGTGFHQASKQNDMQLMVITLLISSYFIYNTKGTFDAPALDEIKFVTELTEKIQSTPNDDTGDEFKKFFPIFMWLLRDVHLEPMIKNKTVSVREYFTEKVLKKEKGFNRKIQDRQWIRSVFLQMFQKYDAFTLPMPHSNKSILQKLGDIPRNQLEKSFVDKMKIFCDKVMKETQCKVLFSKKPNGKDDYIQCTGSHLAGWIEECIDSVNNPDKIPEISSMTEAVMATVYRESKNKAIKQYKSLLNIGLNKLKNNNDKQPLDKNEIIKLHLNIFNTVLNENGKSLQISDNKNNNNNQSVVNQQQIKAFNQFCHEIGHNSNDVKKIGEKGIMYQVLSINKTLSVDFCNNWLNKQFTLNIEPMLSSPKEFEAKDVISKFNELESNFYIKCKGPAKDECWKQFRTKRMNESLQYFKKMKGFNIKLLKVEQEAAEQREESRLLEQQINENKQEMAQQEQLMKDEMDRAEQIRKEQEEEYKKQIIAAQQRAKDMQSTQFNELAKAMQTSTNQLTKEMIKMQQENNKTMQQMTQNMMSVMSEIANRPQPEPVVIREPGFCLIQ